MYVLDMKNGLHCAKEARIEFLCEEGLSIKKGANVRLLLFWVYSLQIYSYNINTIGWRWNKGGMKVGWTVDEVNNEMDLLPNPFGFTQKTLPRFYYIGRSKNISNFVS